MNRKIKKKLLYDVTKENLIFLIIFRTTHTLYTTIIFF